MFDIGDGFTPNSQYTNLAPGEYQVFIQDDMLCMDSIELYLSAIPLHMIDIVGDTMLTCAQSSIQLQAFSTEDSLEFVWTNTDGDTVSMSAELITDLAGVFLLESTDWQNACVRVDTVQILYDFEEPDFVLSDVANLSCEVDPVFMTYTLDSIYEYMHFWLFSDGNSVDTILADTLVATQAGDYAFYIQNLENGCFSISDFQILEEDNTPSSFFEFTINMDQMTLFPSPDGMNITESWTIDGEPIIVSDDNVIYFSQNGLYEICYSVENECGMDIYCEVVEVDGITSTQEVPDWSIGFSVLGETLCIDHGRMPIKDAELLVHTVSGQLIHAQTVNSIMDRTFVKLPETAHGVLLVQLNTSDYQVSDRIFVH